MHEINQDSAFILPQYTRSFGIHFDSKIHFIFIFLKRKSKHFIRNRYIQYILDEIDNISLLVFTFLAFLE